MDWSMEMSTCDVNDLPMPPHNFFHHSAAVQPGRIHPLYARPKRRVMHENQRRKITPGAKRIIEPSQPLLAPQPVIVSRHRGIESNKAQRKRLNRIVHERRVRLRHVLLTSKCCQQGLAPIVIAWD
jgi:hypothetical protein